MSSRSRIALLAAAAVVLVVAFVVASSGGDDDNDSSSSTQATAPASTSTTDGSSESTGGTEAPQVKVTVVRIKGGKNATGDVQKITYKKGDTVRIRYVSDTALEAHLHGYDKAVEIPANGSKTLTFKANADGIFEIENEDTGDQLASLQIEP